MREVRPSIYLSIYLSIYASDPIYLSIYLSTYLLTFHLSALPSHAKGCKKDNIPEPTRSSPVNEPPLA